MSFFKNPSKTSTQHTHRGSENPQTQTHIEENLDSTNLLESSTQATHRDTSEKFRITFYIFLETKDETTRIGKVSSKLKEQGQRTESTLNKILEEAVEIAFQELYRLKDNNIPFKRIFISKYENIEKAKKDQNSFNYFS